ncbi:Bacteriophage HK97-gp10, putative tail-component [Natronincola peptidivorans]|uniref:Bacteriophage HK97-gp10, putative tail-component n=1 Tax=Natronincola peptidivorans TaxID=426128 RepID=A0A1I0FDY3_9FIRM|nr:HK97 gp10 family phage protein [Natronincola peptidivorans]SET55547.1 Bacteriophage HK97-gp10, putative tail-component [Natronincola peptidivorans]
MLDIEDVGMDEFRETLSYFEKNFPRESKKMMNRVGTRIRAIIKKKANQVVDKKTGNYYKSIKKGRVFESGYKELTVRVFPSYKIAPHAHLIEKGHRNVGKDGSENGYTPGKYIFDKAGREIDSLYTKIVEKELDKAFKKL